MSSSLHRARDLALLDAVDACKRESFAGDCWRVVRDSRDPLMGSPSRSRWCDVSFNVLYTSLEADGAVAEVHAFLALQPVFPSKLRWFNHQLRTSTEQTLRLVDTSTLSRLGVDMDRYRERDYAGTQAVADAAFFLGFDGLIAPSARWRCLNLILFTDRLAPEQIELVKSPAEPISWSDWRKQARL